MKLLVEELKRNCKNLDQSSRRLFHGRGKCFENFERINVDWFFPIVFVDCYGEIEKLKEILMTIDDFFDTESKKNDFLISSKQKISTIFRNRKKFPIECHSLDQETDKKHYAIWNNLKFELDFSNNQNIGYFLDSEHLRELVSKLACNKKVLNLFSYTCSLSVIAKQSNAKMIINVDMNKSVLKQGQRNHFLSDCDTKNVSFLSYNIMKSFSGLRKKGKWDLIIIDPPSFQKRSFEIEKDYKKLIKNIIHLCDEDCDLILTLNSPFFKTSYLLDLCGQYLEQFKLVNIYYSPSQFVERNKENGVKIIHLRN